MMNMPRPRVLITLFVWVATCCGLLMVWQAPLPPSSSSSSSSSSSYTSSNAHDFFLPRSYNKAVPRTHVSNLLYLQPRDKHRIASPISRSSNSVLQDPVTGGNTKTTSSTSSSKIKSLLYPRVKSYPKISFRNKFPKMFGSSSTGYRGSGDPVLPINDPITSHRSRVRDATPTKNLLLDSSTKEKKRLIIHRHLRHERPVYKTQRDSDPRKQSSKQSWTKNLLTTLSQSRRNYKENENDYESVGYRTQEDDHEDTYTNESEMSESEGDSYDEEDDYSSDEYEEVDLGGKFNVTPYEASLLIYNRVPKCASSTMQTILRRLSRHLNFEHVSSLIYDQHQLNQDDQEKLVENLTASIVAAPSHALSYDRHLYYTNFTGLGLNPPVYINVVRDPVERFISSFYYRRSEERLNRIHTHGHLVSSPSFSWVNRTVEKCVLLNDTECTFLPGDEKEMMLSYFCGHHDFCRIVGNHDAVQAAKQVVSQEYSVVGLVEHMDLSLLLMEELVPRFMDGALQIYENIRQHEQGVNINQQKPKVSLAIREELLRRMSDDLDFYYFLEQRLFEQKKYFLSKK